MLFPRFTIDRITVDKMYTLDLEIEVCVDSQTCLIQQTLLENTKLEFSTCDLLQGFGIAGSYYAFRDCISRLLNKWIRNNKKIY